MKKKLNELNVIYAEDEMIIAKSLLRFLSRLFGKITHFENGKKAYDFFIENKNETDLLITDISMPVMNGIELIKAVRKISTEQIPIFVITAHTDEYLEELHELNVSIFNKPLVIEDLKLQADILCEIN